MENNGDVSLAVQANGAQNWPYLVVLMRVALAVGLGLFVGMEREHRGKEAGIRTFALAALLGGLGGLLGDGYALVAMALLGLLIVFLNWQGLLATKTSELTTSVALLVVGMMGVLCGKGHVFTPVTVGILVAALLAWKERMVHFTVDLTGQELRSAILLAILAFVIYPVLPTQPIDPWGLVVPRFAWITVLLIAAVGFINYILLKLYGTRGSALTGFLGGLVNSAVTVTELASRSRENEGGLDQQKDSPVLAAAHQGVLLAIAAMLLRNGILLAILSLPAFLSGAAAPLFFMFAASGGIALRMLLQQRKEAAPKETEESPPVPTAIIESEAAGEAINVPKPPFKSQPATGPLRLESPFSLSSTLKFGFAFLVIHITGTLAKRFLGTAGFYAVNMIAGIVSSSSATAAAGTLAAQGNADVTVAGIGSALASLSSTLVTLPLVTRVGGQPLLAQRLGRSLLVITLAGIVGAGVQWWVIGSLGH